MSTDQNDSRPPVWVGHVSMATPKLADSRTFMEQLGMRPMFRNESVAIFELRGGTHLVLVADENARAGDAPFDLMVEDLDATHADFAERGLSPSPIERGAHPQLLHGHGARRRAHHRQLHPRLQPAGLSGLIPSPLRGEG